MANKNALNEPNELTDFNYFMDPMIRVIPLFPLGVVLLPGMELPLHIFEERYKLMISECLGDNRLFGILFFDGESMRSVGCTARITKVVKRYDDGRMDIVTRGEDRFVVEGLSEEKPYLEGRVMFFDDEDAPSDQEQAAERQTGLRLLKDLVETGFLAGPLDRFASLTPKDLSFAIAGLEGFIPAERQRFLEMTSGKMRLQKSVQALARMVERLKLNREIQRIIGGNGQPTQSLIEKLYTESKD